MGHPLHHMLVIAQYHPRRTRTRERDVEQLQQGREVWIRAERTVQPFVAQVQDQIGSICE